MEKEIKKLINAIRSACNALELELSLEANTHTRARFWCAEIWENKWELWSEEDDSEGFWVICEKVKEPKAPQYLASRPTVGDVIKFSTTHAYAYRIVELPGVAKEEEPVKMWAYRERPDDKWKISHAHPGMVIDVFSVMCRKVNSYPALIANETLPAVGETWKCDAYDDHAWRIVESNRAQAVTYQSYISPK